tara:strand:+ start:1962 stop:2723 length:762 start_codon:yes stop_codon:yes gene_type:complete
MHNKQAQLEPDRMYHIYNRANGNERLFLDAENYRFFLEKYQLYISPIAQTYCYCIMPNHFHFLVKIKSEKELLKALPKFQTLEELEAKSKFQILKINPNLSGLLSKQFSNFFNAYSKAFNKQNRDFPKFQTLENLEEQNFSKEISKQFSKLFSSYTQSFNKVNNRKGSLFMKNFKRKAVTDSKYLIKLIHYIHHNPVEASLVSNPQDWAHSSYSTLITDNPTFIQRDEVLELFDGTSNFQFVHRNPPQITGIE